MQKAQLTLLAQTECLCSEIETLESYLSIASYHSISPAASALPLRANYRHPPPNFNPKKLIKLKRFLVDSPKIGHNIPQRFLQFTSQSDE